MQRKEKRDDVDPAEQVARKVGSSKPHKRVKRKVRDQNGKPKPPSAPPVEPPPKYSVGIRRRPRRYDAGR